MIPMPGLHWGRIEGNEAWLIGCTSARTLYLGPGSSRSPSAEPTVCRSVHHFNVTVQPSSLNRIEGFAMPGRRDHARHGPWDNVGRVLRENTIKSLIQRDIPVRQKLYHRRTQAPRRVTPCAGTIIACTVVRKVCEHILLPPARSRPTSQPSIRLQFPVPAGHCPQPRGT